MLQARDGEKEREIERKRSRTIIPEGYVTACSAHYERSAVDTRVHVANKEP